MRRLISYTSIALVLGISAGCHHWQTRPVAAVGYSNGCDPSVGAPSAITPINSVAGPPVVSKVLPSGAASGQYP
jgi:hypothetical protein